MRIARAKIAQPDQVEQLDGASFAFSRRNLENLERQLNVGLNAAPFHQRRRLKDNRGIAGAAAFFGRAAVNHNATLIRREQIADQSEERGFAAAGWANERKEFAGAHIQRDIAQRQHAIARRAVELADGFDSDQSVVVHIRK